MAAVVSRRRRPPSYRHHKGTGQAVVTLNGKDFYLGVHGTPASKQKYDRLIAEWYANGRQVMPKGAAAKAITVNEIAGTGLPGPLTEMWIELDDSTFPSSIIMP